ncbi:MAG TPA: hypothetical protein VK986_13890 [Tepidisphaeraceae bacterium]|nr:hypothetical protein [Tepidisphaeraceae bacterium]
MIPWRTAKILTLLVGLHLPASAGKSIFDDDWTPPSAKEAPAADAKRAPERPPTVKPLPTPPAVEPRPGSVAPPPPVGPPDVVVPPPVTSKHAIPAKADQDATRKVLRVVFAEQLADRTPAGRRTLVEALRQQAEKSAPIPTERFVLLAAVVNAAVEATDLPGAFRAAEQLAGEFAVDGPTVKATAFAGLDARSVPAAAAPETIRAGVDLARELTDSSDFSAAAKVCAGLAAIPTTDRALRDAVQKAGKEVEADRLEAVRLAAASEKLKGAPDDPAANQTLGLHACLRSGAWEVGVRMLSKSADPALRAVAGREAAALTPDPAKPMSAALKDQLGDAWWDLAEREKAASTQARMRTRAGYWYRLAQPDLIGLTKAKVERRLASINPAAAPAATPASVATNSGVKPAAPGAPGLPKRPGGAGSADLSRAATIESLGYDPVPFDESTETRKGRGNWALPEGLKKSKLQIYSKVKKDQGQEGMTEFRVTKAGTILVACNWEYQGNDGGGWKATRMTQQQFVEQGWRIVPVEQLGGPLMLGKFTQVVFSREVREGETYKLRCNKYDPPFVILPAAE